MSEINFGAIATEWNRGGARRALAELDRQGYLIVPKDPIEDQLEAGYQALDNHESVADLYRAMLAFAPKVG
jgi:hypothetical protein